MYLQVHRCRESVEFSLQCAWLLDAYSSDASLTTQKKSHGTKLKNLILSDELRPKTGAAPVAQRDNRHLTLSVKPVDNDQLRQSHLLAQVSISSSPFFLLNPRVHFGEPVQLNTKKKTGSPVFCIHWLN